ncbi:MAG: hypothetical protein HZB42_09005 [Sphingobacteriales bacterium]|nr:hypothetical protein [Sphingobacteriales bacterium]
MNFRRIIFLPGFLFIAGTCSAQSGASIKASVDKNKILIGEPFILTIEANQSPESVISFVSIDSIEHFEFLERPKIDTSTVNGSTLIRGVYKLTSFDSGHWVIPSFILFPSVKTDSIHVDVMFSDFDPNQDYHDIKDIIDVKPKENKQQWWWYAAAGALLVILIILYLRKREKTVIAVISPKEVIDPYDEAMAALNELQRNKPDNKLYHSKLVDIFRLYVFRKKGILSLQKTTDDLVMLLKDLNMPRDMFDKLSQSLRLSDFVKFAKYKSTEEDDKICFDNISESIKRMEQSGSNPPPKGGS